MLSCFCVCLNVHLLEYIPMLCSWTVNKMSDIPLPIWLVDWKELVYVNEQASDCNSGHAHLEYAKLLTRYC